MAGEKRYPYAPSQSVSVPTLHVEPAKILTLLWRSAFVLAATTAIVTFDLKLTGEIAIADELGLIEGVDPVPSQSDPERASAFIRKKEWQEAVTILTELKTRSGLSSRQTEDLSRALLMLGRRVEALELLNQSYDRSGSSGRLRLRNKISLISRMFLTHSTQQIFLEGQSLLEGRKFAEAQEKFNRALRTEGDNVEVLLRHAQAAILDAETETRLNSTVERLTFAMKLSPLEPEIKLWLGRAKLKTGEAAAALTLLTEAHKQLPRSELAAIWLAETQMSLGQKTAALATLENSVASQPFHLRALLEWARLRSSSAIRDVPSLTAVRRDLQVGLSRLSSYATLEAGRFESELGVDLRDASLLRSEIQSLFQRVEARIAQSDP